MATPRDAREWSAGEVAAWLGRNAKLSQFSVQFEQEGVDGESLLSLEKEDLKELGVRSFGARKEFLKQLKSLRDGEPGARPTPETKTPDEDIEEEGGRPQWGPGLHVVPHKVVVLDRRQAMKQNRLFHRDDFMSLRRDALAVVPGGELKIILVVGATGAGKSTMINSLVNYLYRVRFEDPFRLSLIREPPMERRKSQADTQTYQVFGYVLDRPPALGGRDSLMIIDTPGFGDARGVEWDERNIEQIGRFLDEEVQYLHAVCLVVKSPDCRLTHTRKWMFDRILGLFGKDIEAITTPLFTFADAREPPALAAVKQAGVKYQEMFKLNNSAYFQSAAASTGHDRVFNAMFWELGQTAFKMFVDFVSRRQAQGLEKTRAVLKRREQLKCQIHAIRDLVEAGLGKLSQLELTIAAIVEHQTLIETNKEFAVTVTEYRMEQRTKPRGTYVAVCMTCQWTCHKNCAFPDDGDKSGCAAMDSSGCCTQCPKKCHWSAHKNTPYFYERVSHQVTRTHEELHRRYVIAQSTKSEFEQILEGSRREFEDVQAKVSVGIRQVKECVNELQRIALRPNTFHTDEYFDLMVDQERMVKKPGYQERVAAIRQIKERSKAVALVTQGEYDPFKERRDQLMADAREGRVGSQGEKACLVM